jgi:hypothetical protein
MGDVIQQWWSALPAGAMVFLSILLGGTTALVRAGFHPTTFALISWPGTVAHELSHALVGLLLGAKPCSFSLFPKDLGGGRWQLGAVGFSGLRWWNAPWTALAPMLLAPLALYLATAWAYPAWDSGDAVGGLWRLALCALFLQASCPSSTDLRVAAPGIAILGALAVLLW